MIREWVHEYERSKELMVLAGIVAMLFRDLNNSHSEYRDLIATQMSFHIADSDIPDRAFDMHTREGKRRGRGYDHFFRKAASVRNERFPNDWEKVGEDTYLRAKKSGLDKAPDLVKAIKDEAFQGKSGRVAGMLILI